MDIQICLVQGKYAADGADEAGPREMHEAARDNRQETVDLSLEEMPVNCMAWLDISYHCMEMICSIKTVKFGSQLNG